LFEARVQVTMKDGMRKETGESRIVTKVLSIRVSKPDCNCVVNPNSSSYRLFDKETHDAFPMPLEGLKSILLLAVRSQYAISSKLEVMQIHAPKPGPSYLSRQVVLFAFPYPYCKYSIEVPGRKRISKRGPEISSIGRLPSIPGTRTNSRLHRIDTP
jgi:hypothetical protein